MRNCQRTQTIDMGDGYSLLMLGEGGAIPTPEARSFELQVIHYKLSTYRPANVRHVKLVITLDFEQESIKGTDILHSPHYTKRSKRLHLMQ